LLDEAFIKVSGFESRARIRGEDKRGGMDTLSMLMIDTDFNGDVFDLDEVFFAQELKDSDWQAFFPVEDIGKQVMAVFLDIHGNEAREVISREKFGIKRSGADRKRAVAGVES
jgi:site-specific DNA-methyltransferase (adenine-specific)/adenine-specific DNA-methyltransferase